MYKSLIAWNLLLTISLRSFLKLLLLLLKLKGSYKLETMRSCQLLTHEEDKKSADSLFTEPLAQQPCPELRVKLTSITIGSIGRKHGNIAYVHLYHIMYVLCQK